MSVVSKRKRREALLFIEFIVCDAEYRAMLLKRARAGVLNPSVEMMLWNYYLGKPGNLIDKPDLTELEDLTDMSVDQIQERLAQLQKELESMKLEQRS